METLAELINNKLRASRQLPSQVTVLPQAQQEGVQEYINNGYIFKEVANIRSAYRRMLKYVILIDLAGNEVCINNRGNNRNMYGY